MCSILKNKKEIWAIGKRKNGGVGIEMNKENGIYIHNDLLIRRKNETMASSGTGKKADMIIASEVRETGSDRYNTDDLSKHPSGGHRRRTQNRAELPEANLER